MSERDEEGGSYREGGVRNRGGGGTHSKLFTVCVAVCVAVSHVHTGDRWGYSQSDVAHCPSHSPYCFWGLDVFV